VVNSLYTGGVPIQGSYIQLGNIDLVMDLEARDDAAVAAAGTPVTIDVLENDTGANISISGVSDIESGTAEIVGNKIVYTPAGDKAEVFKYTIVDEKGKTNSALVTVTVADPLTEESAESVAGGVDGEDLDEAPVAAESIEIKPEVGGEVGSSGSDQTPVEADGGAGATSEGTTSEGATSEGATSEGAATEGATCEDAATDGAATQGAAHLHQKGDRGHGASALQHRHLCDDGIHQ